MSSNVLVPFYHGWGTNQSGARFNNVVQADNAWLEHTQDWVQWLFPLKEPSLAVPDSPVLTDVELEYFHNDIMIRARFWQSIGRMVQFYRETHHWLRYTDHNHKRITRIIRSIKFILGEHEARLFYDFIMTRVADAGFPVSNINLKYWEKEVRNGE